jgi:hypothetical protein
MDGYFPIQEPQHRNIVGYWRIMLWISQLCHPTNSKRNGIGWTGICECTCTRHLELHFINATSSLGDRSQSDRAFVLCLYLSEKFVERHAPSQILISNPLGLSSQFVIEGLFDTISVLASPRVSFSLF